jgi:hypothetical protein
MLFGPNFSTTSKNYSQKSGKHPNKEENRFRSDLEAVLRSAQNRPRIASFCMGQMYEYAFWKQFCKNKNGTNWNFAQHTVVITAHFYVF